jgi:anaerobic nitric oxide reductase transcription regulator
MGQLRGSGNNTKLQCLSEELHDLAGSAAAREKSQNALLRELTMVLPSIHSSGALDIVMDALIRLSGAERGFALLQPHGILAHSVGDQEIVAARNMTREALASPENELSRRIVGDVLTGKAPIRLENALTTPPYDMAESVTRLKIMSVLSVPLMEDGQVFGAIYLENRKVTGVFSEEAEATVAAFAAAVGPALRRLQVSGAAAQATPSTDNEEARPPAFADILGQSPALKELVHTAAIAAASDIPILIQGESGTGKELLARAIHAQSLRADRAFVSVNCAALPPALLESELFGHVRGAFTGATEDRPGLFATAHQGTLFLDEIGDMAAELQAKLLRVLQSGEYRAVGSDRNEMTDVRIVAATARDMNAEVEAERFRQDLYFRLKGVLLQLPPLRERREDIPTLTARFLAQFGPSDHALELDDEARACVLTYNYPGNIRELETAMRRAALFAKDGLIGREALPPEMVGLQGRLLALPPRIPTTAAELLAAKQQVRECAVAEVERAFLLQALSAADGRPGEAARRTEMNRSQFARMLGKYGLAGQATKKAE